MDTIGNLIDKLYTVNLKLNYTNDEHKIYDLEIQKNRLIEEIDDLSKNVLQNKINDYDIIRPQHKTY